jgi:glycosyltransferase involved in cell wall biosynthesis
MDKAFLVSVIIPTKNSAKTLEVCLESIKNQTYKNIEIIIIDNNSTDNTKEIAGKYTDKVFNYGPERSAQRNFGGKNSNGENIIFIDSDMKLSERIVESCFEKVKESESTKGIVIPEESYGVGFWAKCKKLERSFYIGVDWMEAARFFDKKVFQEVGGYDENMTSGEDWDLSQRVGQKYAIERISEFIYHNEGEINLFKTIIKKFYYAKMFSGYIDKKENKESIMKQTSIIGRYKLFFSNPKKLFSNPMIGLGMIFMKTCEFGFGGMGYLAEKIRH